MGDDSTEENSRRNTTAEAGRLGVDPMVWAHVRKYWAETNKATKKTPLKAAGWGRCGCMTSKPLKKGGTRR